MHAVIFFLNRTVPVGETPTVRRIVQRQSQPSVARQLKTVFGADESQWQAKFQTKNAAGVAAWEAYVLGLESAEEWNALSMIVAQGAATANGVTITIPASDQALLNSKTKRLVVNGGIPGVSAVKYELIGSANSDMSGAEAIGNASDSPSFVYDLVTGMAGVTVRYFKISRRYTFANQ